MTHSRIRRMLRLLAGVLLLVLAAFDMPRESPSAASPPTRKERSHASARSGCKKRTNAIGAIVGRDASSAVVADNTQGGAAGSKFDYHLKVETLFGRSACFARSSGDF
jgi:hypothetical protein